MCFPDMFDMDGDGELDDVEKAFGDAAFLGYMEEERRRKEAEEKEKSENDFNFPSPDDIIAERYGFDAAKFFSDNDDDKDSGSSW